MSDTGKREVVGRSKGTLKGPGLPDKLQIQYDFQISATKPSAPDGKALAEQVVKKIRESGS